MKTILAFLMTCIASGLHAQSFCSLWPRFDQEVFDSVSITSNIPYGNNVDYQGVSKVLYMDVYEPASDTMEKRPLIIFAHGGSFVAGDKTNTDQVDLCTHFAKRGYVTATINYRLGIEWPINAANASKAVYRAMQDMKAAIRYFRQDAATTDSFAVDTGIIFIGGTSAGAFTALHTAYMDSYSELPAGIDTAVLGDLEGISGNPGYSSHAHGVINLCGALGSAQFIQPGDVPLVSMHGTNDQTVPYNTQMLYLFGLAPVMVVDGSYSIHDYLQTTSIPEAMYTWYGAGHVPYDGGDPVAVAYLDTTVRFVSNFLYSLPGCVPSDPDPLPNTFIPAGINEGQMNMMSATYLPNAQQIVIHSNSGMQATLFDSRGKCMGEQQLQSGTSTMSAAGMSAGLYFIHCKTVEKQAVYKILIW